MDAPPLAGSGDAAGVVSRASLPVPAVVTALPRSRPPSVRHHAREVLARTPWSLGIGTSRAPPLWPHEVRRVEQRHGRLTRETGGAKEPLIYRQVPELLG